MPDCPNVRLIIKASKRKGEDHYENYVKTSKLLKACVWALLLLAGLHLGGIKTLAAARPSCEKTKTVYYQKQNFKNPQTQERYVVYDFLGTNEISLQNVSSKAVVSNLKSSNSHISVYYNSVTKKISLDLNYTAKTLKMEKKQSSAST